MEYKNFNLRIESKLGEAYQVEVDSEGMGEANGVLTLSPECLKIAAELKNIEALEDGSKLPMNLGVSLYRCLFQNNVGTMLYKSLGAVSREDEKGLRIRLRLSPPEIAAIPWEVLYDQDGKFFLSTSEKTPLTRYIELSEPIKDLKIAPPLRVLALIPGGSGLDVEKEERIIKEALDELGTVQICVLKGKVTRSAISRALVEEQYHILHFVGHGTFTSDQGYLLINSEENGDDRVSADTFADFFRSYPSLKLVVLNSCQGATVSSTRELAGMAPQLVARGIPAVIAMQYPISDEAALVFAKEFYLKLCSGWSRGQVDTAISHARNRIHMDVKEPMAFATPVLFMRSPTGTIFDLEREADEKPTIFRRFSGLFTSAPVKNVNRLKQVKKTYETNIEAWQEKIREGSPETVKEANEAIVREQEEITAVDERIIQWNRTFAASLLATLIVFLMGYVGLFEVVGADSFLERKFIPYMDNYVTKKLDKNVRLILAEEGVNGRLGVPGREWRKYHVPLINALAGKAKVIVFDLELSVPSDEDKAFAEAIKHAEDSRTHVILAKVVNEDGETTRDIAADLGRAVSDRWGNIQVGGTNWGFVRSYQLAQSARDRSPAEGQLAQVSVPSLALQSVAQFISPNSKPRILIDEDKEQIQIDGAGGKSIPVYRAQPAIYNFAYDLVDNTQIKAATRSYLDVYDRLGDDSFLREFEGKIVFVGFKKPDDYFRVAQGETRYGTEIHANVVSNILGNVYVRWVSSFYQFLIVGVMVGVGALVRARFSQVLAIRLTVPFTDPKKRLDIPGLLFAADVLYLLIAFLLYKTELIYIVQTYHLVAPFIAYWLTGKMRRRATLKPARGPTS